MIENNIVFTTAGNLPNMFPGSKANPRECEEYTARVNYTTTGSIKEIKRWYIEGELPKGLELIVLSNHLEIKGNVKAFVLQELPSGNYYPKEPLNIDGSNRLHNGGFKHDTYTFNFSVVVDYIIIDELDPLLEAEIFKTEKTDLNITVIKSGNINNTLFIRNYLENEKMEEFNTLEFFNGELTLVVKKDYRNIPYNNKKYYKKDLAELYRDHPGPFSKCKE